MNVGRGFTGKSRAARTGDVSAEVNKLRDDLARVRDDLGDLASALLEAGRGSTEAAREGVREQVRRRLQRVSDSYTAARRRGDETVAEHPLASISSAFAAGILIAALLALVSFVMRR